MIWILIVLGVVVIGQSVLMFWGVRGAVNPTPQELIEDHWFEYLTWASNSKNYAGLSQMYMTQTLPDSKGVSVRVPLPNERNFWLWYLEYKHGDKARELNKSRKG